MGLQDYYYVSAFSQASALAMTWDKDAMYAQSKAIATEFYLKGIQVLDGPTSQPLGRTPWGGRLVETFGPDPYLNGIATGLGAKAYKDTGVIGGIKVCNLVAYTQVVLLTLRFLALHFERAGDQPYWKYGRRRWWWWRRCPSWHGILLELCSSSALIFCRCIEHGRDAIFLLFIVFLIFRGPLLFQRRFEDSS